MNGNTWRSFFRNFCLVLIYLRICGWSQKSWIKHEKKKNNQTENDIKKCYATWADNYFDEYYIKSQCAYPPIHVEIVKDLLKKYKPKNLLDAGCGPASMLRLLNEFKIDKYEN